MPTLKHIKEEVALLDFFGDDSVEINKVVKLDKDEIDHNTIAWCNDKNKEVLLSFEKGSFIVSEHTFPWLKKEHKFSDKINWLVVSNPRKSFMELLKAFFVEKDEKGIISSSAVVHHSSTIDKASCFVGENVVIEKNVAIGENVVIGHNTVIKANTIIHDDVKIGSNCTIGGVGFGYELNEEGVYELIPHIGNVVLSNKVEIGNNVTIDRGVLGSTFLEEEVKVDNLVHIAHGVKIDKNSLIIANAMIAGSVEIGKNVWVAPSTSIIQGTKIGDNSLMGLGSVVLKNVEENSIVAGVPAKKLKDK